MVLVFSLWAVAHLVIAMCCRCGSTSLVTAGILGAAGCPGWPISSHVPSQTHGAGHPPCMALVTRAMHGGPVQRDSRQGWEYWWWGCWRICRLDLESCLWSLWISTLAIWTSGMLPRSQPCSPCCTWRENLMWRWSRDYHRACGLSRLMVPAMNYLKWEGPFMETSLGECLEWCGRSIASIAYVPFYWLIDKCLNMLMFVQAALVIVNFSGCFEYFSCINLYYYI